MNYETLEYFIKYKMSMTHIYQPVMIKKLLESNNQATAEEIAKEFIDRDKSLLKYYKERVKVWPKKTLVKHNIVEYNKGTFMLLLDGITPKQRTRLIELCENKTNEYVDKYENRLGIKNNRSSVSGNIRYDIIAKFKGVCAACGINSQKRPMDVDHIIPVNMDGNNDISNLQLLCHRCNREKRDRDNTDFVKWHKRLKHRDAKCSLCKMNPIKTNAMASAVRMKSSESKLHSVIFPRRHVSTFFDLIPAEKNHCMSLVEEVKMDIMERDRDIGSFSVNFD
ncbi:MAG: HNH endonuclease, partial [Thaumarchaeota archaeon]|nr:HNH endonuclease [Nitrososphaerota archaeon]